jgi:hypothetical protein
MDLMEEAKKRGVPIKVGPPMIRCKTFEDNLGVLELARLPKMQPRTRHINVKYHHFREAVAKGSLSICHVSLAKQLANIMTKNLPRDQFQYLRGEVMGWYRTWCLTGW